MPESGSRADEGELLRRMRDLEARVERLERRPDLSADTSGFANAPLAPPPARIALDESATALPALGRALLGMAGAYVLRALSEAGQLPQTSGVFAAIVYASAWLLWAARISEGRRAESALYNLTAGLILGPLLWESTLRFRVISTRTAAATLLLFTLFGMILSWRKRLQIVATTATLTSVLTAAALLIGSHDVVPFLILLLAIAAAVEVSAGFDHWLSARGPAALAADLVVALAMYLLSNRGGLPETYAPISPAWLVAAPLALAGIYVSSVLARTLFRRSEVTWLEALQIAIAFFLVLAGGLRPPGDPRITAAVCVGSGAVCYAVGSAFRGRNLHAYLSLGLLLIGAGTVIALPAPWAALAWFGLAVIGTAAARPVFHWHGCTYLLIGCAASGALKQATELLLSGTDHGGVPVWLLTQTGVALVCYALAVRAKNGEHVLQTVLAALVFWLAAGSAAGGLASGYHAVFGNLAPHAYCATMRTFVIAVGAALAAAAGSLRNRSSLMPVVYPAMILGAYRLLFVDLRQDNKAALVLSLLAYGGTLVLLPRLMAPRQTAAR